MKDDLGELNMPEGISTKKIPLNQIICCDALDGLRELPDECIDLIVTDPPYGIGFMGKDWDKAVPSVDIWRECLRVLKSGAFCFVMSTPRQDALSQMIVRMSEAGFYMGFTSLYWAYTSGFPKACNIGKSVDKRFGAEREVVGRYIGPDGKTRYGGTNFTAGNIVENPEDYDDRFLITIPSTPQARALDGSYGGFQPKPAVEVILVAMKPLSEKTFVDQALKNRKGITWLDDCMVPYESEDSSKEFIRPRFTQGRFPANLLISDGCVDDGMGNDDSGAFSRYFSLDAWWDERVKHLPKEVQRTFPFFIVPKPSKAEKEKGLEGFEKKDPATSTSFRPTMKTNPERWQHLNKHPGTRTTKRTNPHPTVKPLKLFSYLVTLGSRQNDIILDPFIGSGTLALSARLTCRNYIGFDLSEEYCKIARGRVASVPERLEAFFCEGRTN